MFIKFVFFPGPCEEVIECESVERLPMPQGPDIMYRIHLKGERAEILSKVIMEKEVVDVYYMSESGKTVDKIIHTPRQNTGSPSVSERIELAGG